MDQTVRACSVFAVKARKRAPARPGRDGVQVVTHPGRCGPVGQRPPAVSWSPGASAGRAGSPQGAETGSRCAVRHPPRLRAGRGAVRNCARRSGPDPSCSSGVRASHHCQVAAARHQGRRPAAGRFCPAKGWRFLVWGGRWGARRRGFGRVEKARPFPASCRGKARPFPCVVSSERCAFAVLRGWDAQCVAGRPRRWPER